jgi:hypothetical protein
MVTKRTTRIPPRTTTAADPETPEVPQDVERARGKLGGGASKVRVWRIRADGSESYCGETTTRNFGPEYVRAQWGPGDFLARYYDARDAEIDEAETFSIEPVARLTSPQERPERSDDMPAWLPLLLRQMDRGGSSPVDPMKVATDIGGIAAQQMAGMFGVMEAMISRMKVPEAPASSSLSAEKLLEIFLKGLEFGKENSGSGDDGYAGVIREVGKPLADLLGKLATNPDGSAPSPTPTTGPALPEGEQSMKAARNDTPFTGLAEYMPRLQQLARSGANVKLWAATILSQQPDAVDILANMASLAGIEETLEAFFQTFPDARTYDQWYRTLFGALLTEGEEEPPEPDE